MLIWPPVYYSVLIGVGTCVELMFNWLVATPSNNDYCPPQMLLGISQKDRNEMGRHVVWWKYVCLSLKSTENRQLYN